MQTMTNMKRRRHAQTHIEGRSIRNGHGEQGFTLLETTIALLVMLVGALAIGSLFVLATNYKIITIQVSPQTGSRPWARGPVTVISQRATPVLGAYLQ